MIDSSGVLGTSPWNTDGVLLKDSSSLGFENLLLDSMDSLPFSSDLLPEDDSLVPAAWSPSLASASESSDLSNVLAGFLEEDTAVPYNLDLEELSVGATGLSDILADWSDGYGVAEGLDAEQLCRGVSPPAKDLLDATVAYKSWSVMSAEEQLHAVEVLTEAISRKLGLREQLDVIRIIDPSASVDPAADREFVVDLKHLDDFKLKEILDYVRHHASSSGEEEDYVLPAFRRHHDTGIFSSKGSEQLRVMHKREKRKRTREHLAPTWNLRKSQRKSRKEQRIGLFKHKQVLSVSGLVNKVEGDEDGLLLDYVPTLQTCVSHHEACVVKIIKGNKEDEAEEVDILH